jgi:hypothetical protein
LPAQRYRTVIPTLSGLRAACPQAAHLEVGDHVALDNFDIDNLESPQPGAGSDAKLQVRLCDPHPADRAG